MLNKMSDSNRLILTQFPCSLNFALLYTFTCIFTDLLDFPKSRRDPVRVQAYYGTGIECNEPNHGYPCK